MPVNALIRREDNPEKLSLNVEDNIKLNIK